MATRKNTFLLKRSNVAGNIPTTGQIQLGELALNTADVKLYASGTTTNSIIPIGWDRVSRTGDTMTGALYVPTISATTISATTYQNLPNDLPTAGTTGQILAKNSNTNYDVAWIDNYANWTSQLKHEVKAGEAISIGQAVYVSSANGTNMIVSKASNATEATSSKTLGLLAQNLVLNGIGFVIAEGLLAGLNTGSATAGDPVWLGTSGNLIFGLLNKPVAPAHLVYLGVVTRAQTVNGEIFVRPQNGFEFNELHDVLLTGVTNGDLVSYDSVASLWKNSKTLNGSYNVTGTLSATTITATTISATTYQNLPTDIRVTGGTYSTGTATFINNTGGTFTVTGFDTNTGTTSGSGTVNFLPKWTGSTGLGNSLIYDNGTSVGINNSSPTFPFVVGTNVGGTGSDFSVQTNSSAAKLTLTSQSSAMSFGANPQSSYTNGVPPGASFGSTNAGGRTTVGSLLTGAGGATYINFSTNGASTGLHVTHNFGADLIAVSSNGDTSISGNTKISTNAGRLTLNQLTSGSILNGIDFTTYTGGVGGSLLLNQSTGEFRMSTNTSYFPTFYSNGSECMRIFNTGNVAINTTTDAGYKLDVNGSLGANRFYQKADGVPTSNLGNPTITEMALFDSQFNNKTAFYNPALVTFYTGSNGTTWTEYSGFTTNDKKAFVGGDGSSGVYIPNLTPYFSIEVESNAYVFLNALYMYWSSNSHSCTVKTQVRRVDNATWYDWTTSNTQVNSWPGHLYMPFNTVPFYPAPSTSTGHYDKIRFIFNTTWAGGTYSGTNINLYNFQIWGGYPAGKRNVYATDSSANVTFPSNVTSTTLISTQSTGTSPLTVNSTTLVTNLNADYLDGQHGSFYYPASNPNGYTTNTGTVTAVNGGNGMNFTNFTTSGTITMGTPSSTTLASTNALTTNSHTHAFAPGGTAAQYITGAGTLVTFPTIVNTFVTGSTINNATYDLTLTRNDGVTIVTNLGILATDVKVTGGTYNPTSGVVTFTNTTGGTFNVTGFSTGMTDTFVTGGTYSTGTATFTRSNGATFNVTGFNTGSVTAVNNGNGMNFTNFTTSGTITMGTPSSTTLASTNATTTNSHTHAFTPGGTAAQYITGAGTLVTFPTITTVNDGALTLATSGIATGSASFTANQAGASTFTVNVPATDLSIGSNTGTVVRVDSSTGTDATLPVATASLAGVVTNTTQTFAGVKTFNDNVNMANTADLKFVDLAGTFPTSGKGFDWELNNDGARIYAIQPSSDSIDLVFQLRDNATTNDRFVFHVDDYQGPAFDKYPLIIRGGTEFDLVSSALYTNGTVRLSNAGVLQNVTGNISMFTNDSGYLLSSRTLSINGVTYDLTANRSWTITSSAFTGGTVTGPTIFTGGVTANTLSATTVIANNFTGLASLATSATTALNSTNAQIATRVNMIDDASTNSDFPIVWADSTNTSARLYTDAGRFTYNPASDLLKTSRGVFTTSVDTSTLTATVLMTGPSVSATTVKGITVSATTYLNLPSSSFTGGTVTGPTIFTGGLTGNTISATTINAGTLNVTSIPNISGLQNYVSKFTANGTFLGNSLIYDNGTSVGINTTSPSSSDKLHIDGNLRLQNSSTNVDTITFSNGPQIEGNGPAGYFKAGNVFTNTTGTGTGYVGVNNNNPLFQLDVNGNTSINGTLSVSAATTILGPLTVSGSPTNLQYVRINSDLDLFNGYIDTENYGTFSRLRLSRASGTQASPSTPASGTAVGRLEFGAYNTGTGTFIMNAKIEAAMDATTGANDLPSRLSFFTTPDGSTTMAEVMRVNSLGNMRIGGLTMALSDVINVENGSVAFQNGYGLRFQSTGGALYASVYSNNNDTVIKSLGDAIRFKNRAGTANRMSILDGGFVGINTDTPNQWLDVNGDALINGLTVGLGGNAYNNAVLGANALISNVNGYNNVAIHSSLMDNTDGIDNVGVGYKSLASNTIGNENVAVGSGALLYNIDGDTNIAIGARASTNNISGNGNIAIGVDALFSNISGSYNVAMGQGALNLCLGDSNLALGISAGGTLVNGSKNNIIGVNNSALPDGNNLTNENYILSISKENSNYKGLPQIWSPEQVYVNASTGVDIMIIDSAPYSSVFIDYVIEDNSGNMRAGTLKAVFNNGLGTIKWDENTTSDIGSTVNYSFNFNNNGGGLLGVRLLNSSAGNDVICNFTSRILLRAIF